MSKGNRIWLDCETTGLSKTDDQILEFAAIAEDENGKELERLEIKLKLKHGIVPGPIALSKNAIDPFSQDWADEAVDENAAAKSLAEFAKRHTRGSTKPNFCAYNADFDKERVAVMLGRSGYKFRELFNRSVYDPLKTARGLVASGKLETREKTVRGRPGRSSSLEDVAAALGIQYPSGVSHRAMADTEVLRGVARALYRIATGHDIYDAETAHHEYDTGHVIHVVTDSKSSGVKRRHLLVIANDPIHEQVIAMDEDDIKTKGSVTESCIRTFNYGTIINDLPVDESAAENLNAIFQHNQEKMAPLISLALEKQEKMQATDDDKWEPEVRDFALIETLEQRISAASNPAAEKNAVKLELYAQVGDPMSIAAILTKAEQLALAKGRPGWNEDSHAHLRMDEMPAFSATLNGQKVFISLHPAGIYQLKVGAEGRTERAQTKTALTGLLQERLGVVGKPVALTNLVRELPQTREFEQQKHPAVIRDELKRVLEEMKTSGASAGAKAAISGLCGYLESNGPKIIEGLDLGVLSSPAGPVMPGQDTWVRIPVSVDPVRELIKGRLQRLAEATTPKNAAQLESPQSDPQVPSRVASPFAEAKNPVLQSQSDKKTLELGKLLGDRSAHQEIAPQVPPLQEDSYPSDPDYQGPVSPDTPPCALCARPLSSLMSLEASMGPACRAKSKTMESDETIELSDFTKNYKDLSQRKPAAGTIVALKYRSTDGSESEKLVEIMGYRKSSDNQQAYAESPVDQSAGIIDVVDRRKARKLIAEGKGLSESIYGARRAFDFRSVQGTSKISGKGQGEVKDRLAEIMRAELRNQRNSTLPSQRKKD